MVNVAVLQFIKQSFENFLAEQEPHEVNWKFWPSGFFACPKRNGYDRYLMSIDERPVPPIDDLLRMRIGSMVGATIADAIVWATTDNPAAPHITTKVEEPVETQGYSGKIDVILCAFEGKSEWPIEAKYTGYFPPGVRLHQLEQLCLYMQMRSVSTGFLFIAYTGGGYKIFQVEDMPAGWQVFDENAVALRPPENGDTVWPTNRYGDICVSRTYLFERVTTYTHWLEAFRDDPEAAKRVPGPLTSKAKMDFRCASGKPPEFYKIDYKDAKTGDLKPGTGELTIICPLFSLCYTGIIAGAELVQPGQKYSFTNRGIIHE